MDALGIYYEGGSIKQVLYSTAGETGHATRTGEDGSSGTGKIGHSTSTKRKHKTATRKRQHGELRLTCSSAVAYPGGAQGARTHPLGSEAYN